MYNLHSYGLFTKSTFQCYFIPIRGKTYLVICKRLIKSFTALLISLNTLDIDVDTDIDIDLD